MNGPYQSVTFIKVKQLPPEKFALKPAASIFLICKMGTKPWPIPHFLMSHLSACRGQGEWRSDVSSAEKTRLAEGLPISSASRESAPFS